MRLEGNSHSQIASSLGISVNTIKSYCRRNTLPVGGIDFTPAETTPRCKQCGKRLVQDPKRKTKRFCSDVCRYSWWDTHRNTMAKKTAIKQTCAHCGRPFESYDNEHRKYCSHACYIKDRFGGTDAHDARAVWTFNEKEDWRKRAADIFHRVGVMQEQEKAEGIFQYIRHLIILD